VITISKIERILHSLAPTPFLWLFDHEKTLKFYDSIS
jgi:hypothetical protein